MHFDFNPASPTIWVFGALVLFIALLLYKGIHRVIAKALDTRANKIREELDGAKRLREEAQALLASYQRKQVDAEEQAKEIVRQAKADAETMAEKARKDLKIRLARRAKLAEVKIANAEVQAITDVKARAVDLATKAAENLIRNQYKTADHIALIKDGTTQLGKALD